MQIATPRDVDTVKLGVAVFSERDTLRDLTIAIEGAMDLVREMVIATDSMGCPQYVNHRAIDAVLGCAQGVSKHLCRVTTDILGEDDDDLLKLSAGELGLSPNIASPLSESARAAGHTVEQHVAYLIELARVAQEQSQARKPDAALGASPECAVVEARRPGDGDEHAIAVPFNDAELVRLRAYADACHDGDAEAALQSLVSEALAKIAEQAVADRDEVAGSASH